MNVLDENVLASQEALLRNRRVAVFQVGRDLGRVGMKDDEIIPLLNALDRPTFFTRDSDFHRRRFCHKKYCLVDLDVVEELVAEYVLCLLRHRLTNTKATRTGRVIRVSPAGLAIWRVNVQRALCATWD